MCNYPQRNDIWLETSGGEDGAKKHTHTHNLRSMDMTLHKPIHGNQRNLCAWHRADMWFFLELALFGVDAGVFFFEKGGATDQKSLLFKNLHEVLDYQVNYGGKLYKLSDVEVEVEDIEYSNGSSQHISYPANTDNYYILNLKDRAQLKNGFRYVKELLLQLHNYDMYKPYINLKQNNAKIHTVKTDAFVIREQDVEPAKKLLNLSDEIGGWRVSKYNEEIKFPVIYEVVENELVNILVYKSQQLPIKNKYETDTIIEPINVNNPLMTRGELPGTGQSYICQKMVEKDYKVTFVCPTNKLLQAFEGEALTINEFFGIYFGDVKLAPFDYSYFDVIVFDEIYFSSLSIYWRIKQFVELNKDSKKNIGTGDTKQLKPIQGLTNIQDFETYAEHIIENTFDNSILLKECKRLHTHRRTRTSWII